jgi:hypothetical protein
MKAGRNENYLTQSVPQLMMVADSSPETLYLVSVAYWLRDYATSRKVAGSRPDEFFYLPNPSGRFSSLTEMSFRSIKIMFLGKLRAAGA